MFFKLSTPLFAGVCCPNAATVNNCGIYLLVLIQVRMEWVCFGYLTLQALQLDHRLNYGAEALSLKTDRQTDTIANNNNTN